MTETHPSQATDSRTDSRPQPVNGAEVHTTDGGSRQRISTDNRGQSELLGAILLFGLAIAVLVLIQVAAVPAWNQAIEFEHSQRLDGDIERMGQVVSDVAADGGDRSVVVELGVRYPTRPFLFNPGPATGQIATTENRTVYINNSNVTGADNYWQEGSMSFDTRSIQYDPSYNEYREAPETTYEYGRVVRAFSNDYNTSDEAVPIIDGTNINLIFVNGELSEAASTTESIPIEGTSAPSNGVRLSSPDSDPIELRLPTEYPERLADRLDEETGTVEKTTVDGDAVIVELNSTKTYNLRMSRIEVGPSSFENDAAYITTKRGQQTFFPNSSVGQLTVEIRDGFNNPVAGQEVEFTSLNPTCGAVDPTGTTSEDGQVTVDIDTTADVCTDAQVRAELADDPSINTTFTYDTGLVGAGDVSGGDGDGDGDGDGPEDAVSTINPAPGGDAVRLITVSTDKKVTTMTFDNDADSEATVQQVRISYYFKRTQSQSIVKATYDYDGDTPDGDIPGPFVTFDGPTLASDDSAEGVADNADPSDQASFEVTFKDSNGKDNGLPDGDFFILSIEYDISGGDTRIYSYFVALTK